MVQNFKTVVSYLSLIFIISTAEENWSFRLSQKPQHCDNRFFSVLGRVRCDVEKKNPHHNLICSLSERHSINTCLSLYRIFWFCPFQTWLLLFLSSKSFFPPNSLAHWLDSLSFCWKTTVSYTRDGNQALRKLWSTQTPNFIKVHARSSNVIPPLIWKLCVPLAFF